MIALAEDGGLQRYEDLQTQIAELTKQKDKIEKQLIDLPFKEAQLYHEQKEIFKDLKSTLPQLEEQCQDLSKEETILRNKLEKFDKKVRQAQRQAKELDATIFKLSEIIRARKGLNVDGSDVEIDPDIKSIINRIFQNQDLLSDTELLSESLAQIDFVNLKNELDDKEKRIDEQSTYYGYHIDSALHKDQTGLSDMEKELVAGSKRNPSLIHSICTKVQDTINSIQEENITYHEDITGHESRAKERLVKAGRSAEFNLRAFRKVCRQYNDKATFHIKTDISDPESINAAIKEVHRKVLKWIEENQSPTDLLESIQKDAKLTEEIANELYRGLFKTPSILVTHPDIRGGHKIPFSPSAEYSKNNSDGDLSVGQMIVLELMMLIRLAEYCAKSEDREINKTFSLLMACFPTFLRRPCWKLLYRRLKMSGALFSLSGFCTISTM